MQHPRTFLADQFTEHIRSFTAQTEQAKSLPNEILSLIQDQGWFQALVPKSMGGQELPLPQAVRLFESLAWADANVGWCVNLGAGANMFSGYLDTELARGIFNDPVSCCAGSGAVSGKAIKTNNGYILSGRWKYASGANHATHFTANAWLLNEAGNPIMENGEPIFRSFIIPAAQITNHKNWDAVGLRATSSNDFEANNVRLPFNHAFTLLKPSATAQGPVYRFPFATMAVVNMTCMITGIAQHFLDEYELLAETKKPLHSDLLLKNNPVAKAIHEEAATAFHNARKACYAQLELVWQYYEQGREAPEQELQSMKDMANTAAATSRKLISDLFPLCGMSIVSPASAMNKIWRDAAVASQHYLLSPLQTLSQQP